MPHNTDLEDIKTETAEAAENARAFAEREAKRLSDESKKLGKDLSREARKAEKS